jgi:hypothetical protein
MHRIRQIVLGVAVLWPVLGTVPAAAADLLVRVSDGDGRPVANAVVGVAPESGTQVSPVAPPATQVVDQRNETFIPYVMIVPRGGMVGFRNSDLTRHHVYSFSTVKAFEYLLSPNQATAPIPLDRTGVVAIGCNIHDRMVSYLYVTDLPRTALTDAEGRARLSDLPEGSYVLHTWHPRLRPGRPEPTQPVRVGAADASALVTLALLRDPSRQLERERQRY